MNRWSFTISHTKAGYDWTVHRDRRLHAHGVSPDYETAWLDSHDAIPDTTILSERRITVAESTQSAQSVCAAQPVELSR